MCGSKLKCIKTDNKSLATLLSPLGNSELTKTNAWTLAPIIPHLKLKMLLRDAPPPQKLKLLKDSLSGRSMEEVEKLILVLVLGSFYSVSNRWRS